MDALGLAAGVAADRVFVGGAVDDRCVVVGVAGAGGGQFGEYGLEGGAGFGGEVAADAEHAVVFLFADRDTAFAGAFLIAEFAIGVQPVHNPLGVGGQL